MENFNHKIITAVDEIQILIEFAIINAKTSINLKLLFINFMDPSTIRLRIYNKLREWCGKIKERAKKDYQ